MDTFLWSALAIGFLGSLHCIGMCGPIALALPSGQGSRMRLVGNRVVYNLGRIITYSALGVLSGLVGRTLALVGLQRALSIAAGIIILVIALVPFSRLGRLLPTQAAGRFVNWLRVRWAPWFKRASMPSMLGIGLLNGLLPCGFLYIGLGAAAVTGSLLHASLYMMLFGVGTMPAMLAVSLFGPALGVGLRRKLARLLPVGAAMLGLLLILRGMSLGIPYVSPRLGTSASQQDACCKP
jgi:hypothetical protein